ncbi:hypothetical protein NDU88_006970 [Pleurodeles waltl]|uniref:Uncharacterized protein n=1 Tax=Pleurodeles waltl TaxID=8319 RepID=A0AAV7VSH0_PLEWA|nr:hypothetical protein NDU88_006970 [Pleurodeles waltl]
MGGTIAPPTQRSVLIKAWLQVSLRKRRTPRQRLEQEEAATGTCLIGARSWREIYASRTVHAEEDCGEHLGDLQLQVLSADDRAALDLDLTVEEVAIG